MKARRIVAGAALCAVLAAAVAFPSSSVMASEDEDPAELARQGMERMLRAIELMIEMIPQYDMPEVLENGDIIIRRKNPDRGPPESPDSKEDEART